MHDPSSWHMPTSIRYTQWLQALGSYILFERAMTKKQVHPWSIHVDDRRHEHPDSDWPKASNALFQVSDKPPGTYKAVYPAWLSTFIGFWTIFSLSEARSGSLSRPRQSARCPHIRPHVGDARNTHAIHRVESSELCSYQRFGRTRR